MKSLIISIILIFNSAMVGAQAVSDIYAIKNKHTNRLLRPLNASKAPGTPIVTYSPRNWKCMTWELDLSKKDVKPINLFSEKGLVVSGNNLKQANSHDASSLEFENVDNGIFRIKNDQELYLTGSTEMNKPLSFQKYQKSDLQLWIISEKDEMPKM